VIALLALSACALAVYLLAHPRSASGIKVTLLAAPPVAGAVWLLEEVFEKPFTAMAVAAMFGVVLIAVEELIVFGTVPVAAAPAWLLVVTADDALKDPGEDPCSMYYGGVGVSKAFPPQAYCRYEDGSTHDLATGTQFVFWVCFAISLTLLSMGLWQAVRDPRTFVRNRRDERRPGNAQPQPDEFAARSDEFLGCRPCWACRSSQRLRDGGGEQPEMVGRSFICGWWRGQCPRASPIAHGDDRSAEAPWSLSPRGDRPPHATALGPGWSPPSSRGFRAPTVRAAPSENCRPLARARLSPAALQSR
jgi:hypothetical protein